MTARSPHPARLAATALLSLGALFVGTTGATAATTTVAPNPKTCNGYAKLCDRRFDQVVLPATHNSMSSAADGFGAPNQPLGIPTQLNDGIRGLLFDTHYGHVGPDGKIANDDDTVPHKTIYLCHVVCQIGATPLSTTLKAIRAFLVKHPDNVLLFDVDDAVTGPDLVKAITASHLDELVYRGPTTHAAQWPTLRTMIRKRQQIVVLQEREGGGAPWLHLAYNGTVQETPYTFETPDLLTDPANWATSCVPNRGGTTAPLFLMNHWSPPSAPDPATSALVNAKAVLVGRARACAQARGHLPTLVAVDQYRSGDLFAAVRELNGV